MEQSKNSQSLTSLNHPRKQISFAAAVVVDVVVVDVVVVAAVVVVVDVN